MSVCGAYKLNKQADYLTRLSVKVVCKNIHCKNFSKVEAKIYNPSKVQNSYVYCSAKTSFQEFNTIKQYKTQQPIWNETYILYERIIV